jgi:hypothetical protein
MLVGPSLDHFKVVAGRMEGIAHAIGSQYLLLIAVVPGGVWDLGDNGEGI